MQHGRSGQVGQVGQRVAGVAAFETHHRAVLACKAHEQGVDGGPARSCADILAGGHMQPAFLRGFVLPPSTPGAEVFAQRHTLLKTRRGAGVEFDRPAHDRTSLPRRSELTFW